MVCDLDRFQIHTNFTGTAKKVYAFDLDGLDNPENLVVLRALWDDPSRLRPNTTPEAVTRDAGERFGQIAVEPLTADELATLAEAGRLDWGSVEPAIFGTLFERSLDPSQRAQLGAHYTGRADIAGGRAGGAGADCGPLMAWCARMG